MTPEQLQILLDMNRNMGDIVKIVESLRITVWLVFSLVVMIYFNIVFKK